MSAAALPLGFATAAFVVVTAGLAGALRGFTGFGFALAAVPALTLVLAPREVVPAVQILQVAAGFQLLPRILREADWRSLRALLVGALVGTPVGTALLADLPADAMRAAIGVVILVAVVALGRGGAIRRPPHAAVGVAIGLVSGLLNGGTAMAGPPVILYFLATARTVEAGRASLMLYFLVLSIAGATAAFAAGLFTVSTPWLAAIMFPALFAGNALGDRFFDRSPPARHRAIALAILAVVGVASLFRSVF